MSNFIGLAPGPRYASESYAVMNSAISSLLEVPKLIDAVHFACVKHRAQRRSDAESTPYINHPVGVAHILSKEAGILDPDVLIAAILHDVVEDTDATLEEVAKRFGASVAYYVRECTDDPALTKEERKAAQVRNAPNKSHGAKLIKLADKLYNLRDLVNPETRPTNWNLDKCLSQFRWTKDVVAGYKGTLPKMEEDINKILHGTFVFEGKEYPCLAPPSTPPMEPIAVAPEKHNIFLDVMTFLNRRNPEYSRFVNQATEIYAVLTKEAGVVNPIILTAAPLVFHAVCEGRVFFQDAEKEFGTEVAMLLSSVVGVPLHPPSPLLVHDRKVVKLARALVEIRDFMNPVVVKTSVEDFQSYMKSKQDEVTKWRGANALLEKKLDEIFDGEFVVDGESYPCLPSLF